MRRYADICHIAALWGAAMSLTGCAERLPGPHPETTAAMLTGEVTAEHPHDPEAFTQGLAWHEGQLYEGTGQRGESSLRRVELESGEVLQRHDMDARHFGEGVTVVGDRIYQLTWRAGEGFVHDRDSFEVVDSFSYDTEGWGLAYDGEHLVMSDGSATLYFLEPGSFEVVATTQVVDVDTPITHLNELEYVDGALYANVWKTDYVVRIDPATGEVTAWIDLAGLRPEGAALGEQDVLNGVAWAPERGTFLVTGKRWPVLYEVEWRPAGR